MKPCLAVTPFHTIFVQLTQVPSQWSCLLLSFPLFCFMLSILPVGHYHKLCDYILFVGRGERVELIIIYFLPPKFRVLDFLP